MAYFSACSISSFYYALSLASYSALSLAAICALSYCSRAFSASISWFSISWASICAFSSLASLLLWIESLLLISSCLMISCYSLSSFSISSSSCFLARASFSSRSAPTLWRVFLLSSFTDNFRSNSFSYIISIYDNVISLGALALASAFSLYLYSSKAISLSSLYISSSILYDSNTFPLSMKSSELWRTISFSIWISNSLGSSLYKPLESSKMLAPK